MAKKVQKPYDITKSGPQDFRTIRKQLASIDAPTDKEYLYEKNINNSYLGKSMYNAAEAAPTVVQSPLYNTKTKLGQSYFDQDVYTKGEFEDASSVRAENQPAIVQAINGTTKGAILAGTTALSGVLGIPYGIYSAVSNKDFSKLWDNDVTRTAQLINDASEEWLPNYYTKDQLESSWYSPTNLLSANFLFDKVIKNIGFTVGAAYSGGIYTKGINAIAKGIGALKAMARTGKTFEEAAKLGARAMQMNAKTRFMKSAVGSTFSAIAEGSVEALNNSKDYVDIYRQKVDAHTAEGMNNAYREFAIAGGQFDGEGNPILDNTPRSVMLQNELTRLQNAKKQAYEEIENTRASMGNADLIANLPILTLGNWLTFGKMYAGGYKAARNTSRVTTRATKEARAAAKAEGKKAVERLNRVVEKAKKTGYQGLTQEEKALVEEGTDHLLGDKTYAALMAIREPLKEGNEEMTQAAAAKSLQNYYGSRVDAIYDAAMDNSSRNQVLDWWQASVQGFKDIYGDFNNYEEGFIGAITGLMGSSTFGKKNNSTSETYLGRSKWIGMSGGVVPQWRNAIKGREQEAEIVSHVNSILKNGNLERDMKHLIAQTFFDEKQRVAAIKNDKLEYKDSELASIFENIMYLKEAGKIDLLYRAIENMDGFTEEDAKAILEMTKKDIDIDGQNVTSLNKRKEDLISESEKLTKQNEEAQKGLDDFILSTVEKYGIATFDSELNLVFDDDEVNKKIKEAKESITRTKETIDNIEKTIEDIDAELANKKSTTISPYLNEDGELKTTQEVLEDLNKRKSKYEKIIGEVTGNMDSIDAATEETLTNDQLKTLTWYKVMMKDWQERANSMTTSMSRFIRAFLNDNVSKEQLAKLDEELGGLDIKHLTAEEMQAYGGALVNRHILRNILGGSQSIVKLLEDIANKYSKEDLGLSLARLLDSDEEVEIGEEKNKKKVKVGDYLFNFIKANLMANEIITQDVKNNFFTLLSDLKKIGKNYNSYNRLLTEYTKNPSKIDAAHQETLNNAERDSNKKRSKNLKDNLSFGGHRGNLAKDLKDNADEIETIGLDEFKNSLNENELKEFTEAESLIDGLDSLNHIIETSDLEDEVKKALQSKAIEALDEVDSVDEFLDKFKSLDPNEALEDALETSNLDDLEKLDKLEDLAAQYKEFMDNSLSKVVDAMEAKRKAQIDDIEEKAKRAADALDKKEKITPPKEKKLREPKEKKGTTLADRRKNKRKEDNKRAEQPKEKPGIEETKEAVKKQGTSNDIANRNARRKKNGYSSEHANRPQLSETFFYGRDLLTYVEYITKNPDRVPKFVASKLFPNIKTQQDFIKAYTKYIKATYQYLKDNGAFEYVKYNLKANDKLIFTVDEALNKEAGVPVVIIKVIDKDGNSHVVGTMKSELDFMSINSRNDTTYGTTEAAQKKLYDEIVYKFKASKAKSSQIETLSLQYGKKSITTALNNHKNRTANHGVAYGITGDKVKSISDNSISFDGLSDDKTTVKLTKEEQKEAVRILNSKLSKEEQKEAIQELFDNVADRVLNEISNNDFSSIEKSKYKETQAKSQETSKAVKEETTIQDKELVDFATTRNGGFSTPLSKGKGTSLSKNITDIGTEKPGWGSKNGLFYYKVNVGGRKDYIAAYFREEPSQEAKEKIESILNDPNLDFTKAQKEIANLLRQSSQTKQSKDDLIHITNTFQGLSHLGNLQEWSKKASDIRTEPDGFGTKDGLFYYKKSHQGGRKGDNITIWFKNEPSQSIKEKIPKLLDESKNLNEFGDKVVELINAESKKEETEFVGAESSVKKLMGGDVAFSNTESSISSIFNNTGTEVIFGIVNGNGIVSTTNADIDSKILQVDIAKAKEGQVYVLIPSNNGSLLPALCYGDVIEDLLEKPNDWYIEETIKAIQKLTNITQIGENKNKVAKWLGISTQTINMSVGHLNADNKFTEDDDIVNADRVRVAYNDSKGKRQYMYIALSDDKTISHENAKKFIASFASRFSIDNPLTVNLDTQRLRDKEYISNMSKYYYTNIVQGQTHSVNDWFLYNKTKTEIDNEERKKTPKPPTRTPSETTPTGKPKDSKETTVEGKEYTVNKDGRVYNEKGELVVGEERTKVLDNENKPSEDTTESEESTEKKETKEKPKESIDLASQLLGGARRGRRRVQEKEEKKEDNKKDDDNKPDKPNYSQDQVNTARARQGNNRRRPNRTTTPSEPSETSKPSESIAPKQKIISKAISLFPNIDKGRIESIVNKIFESVENTYPLIDSIKKAIQFFKNKMGTLNIKAYNNFIDTILSPSEKETLEREGESEFKSSQPVDSNLRVLQRTESILNSIREYINGDITVKSKRLLKVFETIKNIIDSLGKNMIILNNFFNNVIAQTTAIITGVAEVDTENLRLKYAYSNLNSKIQQWMDERGTNIEAYERLSPKQQEDYIRCMI